MQKIKPYEIIANRYKISAESAKYFLGRVQKSFKKHKPPQPLILAFMDAQKFKSLPKPYKVARMMHEDGLWLHPLHAEPAAPEDEKDAYFP